MNATASPATAPTVAVSGYGRREVRPDRVEFHFLIEGLHPSVAEVEQGLQHRRSSADITPVEIDAESHPVTAEVHAVWELLPA